MAVHLTTYPPESEPPHRGSGELPIDGFPDMYAKNVNLVTYVILVLFLLTFLIICTFLTFCFC